MRFLFSGDSMKNVDSHLSTITDVDIPTINCLTGARRSDIIVGDTVDIIRILHKTFPAPGGTFNYELSPIIVESNKKNGCESTKNFFKTMATCGGVTSTNFNLRCEQPIENRQTHLSLSPWKRSSIYQV